MPIKAPFGRLVTPVGFDPDGNPAALAIDADGKLLVAMAGETIMIDGWTAADPFIYLTAFSVKVSGVDVTLRYPPGTKIKLLDGTPQYFNVWYSEFASDTTIHFIPTTDYGLSGGSISTPYYSYSEIAQGFPSFFNYACQISAEGGILSIFSVDNALYHVLGNIINITVIVHVTDKGSGTGALQFTAPVTLASPQLGNGVEVDTTHDTVNVVGGDGSNIMDIRLYDGSSACVNGYGYFVETLGLLN